MTTILDRHYPNSVISSILTNHLRVTELDGELYTHAKMCVYHAISAAEDYTNRILCDALVRFSFDSIDGRVIEMPSAPVREIVTIRYYGEDDQWHQIDGYNYVSSDQRAIVELREMPALSPTRLFGRVEIEARVGFEDFADRESCTAAYPLPGAVVQALCLLSGTFFEYTADTERGSTSELPMSARSLLLPYRIYPYGV